VGDLLIAHPGNPKNELDRSVILITHYNKSGDAAGLQINNPLTNFTVVELAQTVGVDVAQAQSRRSQLKNTPLYYGGNRYTHRVQVIHTRDWLSSTSRMLTNDLTMTSDLSVLTALVAGQGPRQFRACTGVWAWSNLDVELANLRRYHWETVEATPTRVFEWDSDNQWQQCLDQAVKINASQWLHNLL
jgi:putative AlgH/UPF0301 family transcriptional regulator